MTSLRFPLALAVVAIILAGIIGLPALSSAVDTTSLTSSVTLSSIALSSSAADRGSAAVPHVPIKEAQALPLPPAEEQSTGSDATWASGIVPQLRIMLRDADADVQRSALQLIVGLRKEYGDTLDLSALAADLDAPATSKAMTRADRRLLAEARLAVRK